MNTCVHEPSAEERYVEVEGGGWHAIGLRMDILKWRRSPYVEGSVTGMVRAYEETNSPGTRSREPYTISAVVQFLSSLTADLMPTNTHGRASFY